MPLPPTDKCGAGAPAREHASPVSAVWPRGPLRPQLAPDDLHLWLLHSPDLAGQVPHLQSLLSAHELARAARFHFPKDRDAYIVRHGVLRLLLSRYLQNDPAKLEFRYSRRGKPMLSSGSLHFNGSHSGDFVLYAITAACPIGVDIENARPIPDFDAIAANYFSPREVATMRALSHEMRMLAFYTAWTRKEAFLKATGEGIGESLAKVEVTLSPDEEPEILSIPGDAKARAEWKLKAFAPAPGYLAAAAFRHSDLKLSAWNVSST
ncbi:MAG TPA: 4'-phosphopantetheinyl transferase superfamily protein [Terriglobales bacterium]|nr:4'-phosphopantetheinyl transferase superfamily protein [Terriglobales bacterium]